MAGCGLSCLTLPSVSNPTSPFSFPFFLHACLLTDGTGSVIHSLTLYSFLVLCCPIPFPSSCFLLHRNGHRRRLGLLLHYCPSTHPGLEFLFLSYPVRFSSLYRLDSRTDFFLPWASHSFACFHNGFIAPLWKWTLLTLLSTAQFHISRVGPPSLIQLHIVQMLGKANFEPRCIQWFRIK